MSEAFKVGLIGCGTVGQGVARLIQAEADEIAAKTGVRLELARVVDKDLAQPRKAGVPENLISTSAADALKDKSISAIVELRQQPFSCEEIRRDDLACRRSIAAPSPLSGVLHHLRTHGIQHHVSSHLQQMALFLNED